ncbi:GNAT family N-acetyltransferase [Naumannella halotolerans]|uniref:RimJ/RimL family protein N-acetyltransferase n=1 Tax=Naumannella halotolerans TaxID=993414 RepID=A0A4R7J1X5_9ACTN|nr:GNAT family N-acetyltransferase [Naumannella halotolerans]TDT31074.1 RimJ/RimL family protein N-acetyltransferase [Naumannella halotolerans]
MGWGAEVRTERLRLNRPRVDDIAALHAIYSDPAVWTHLPSMRFTAVEQTQMTVVDWIRGWEDNGLGPWMVRTLDDPQLLGHCGCTNKTAFWNLGYRFAPAAQGYGYASEVARLAIERAHQLRPDLPVIAYLVEHNVASARVAERVGLQLRHRGPDKGNPDPEAIRLIYSDRRLTAAELAAARR